MDTLLEGRRLPLREKFTTRFEVASEEDGPTKITGILSVADQKNLNGRYYSLETWRKALPEAKKNIARHPGLIDHPEGQPSVADIGVNWQDFWIDEEKRVWGSGTLVPTRKGLDAAAVLASGVEVGISSRGYGSQRREKVNGEDVMVIYEYELESFDLVTQPSCPSAYVTQVESEQDINWDRITIEGLTEHRQDLISAIESNVMNDNEIKENEAPVTEATETEVVEEKVEATESEDAPTVEETETPAVEDKEEAPQLTEAEVALREANAKIAELTALVAEREESGKAALKEATANYVAMLNAITAELQGKLDMQDFDGMADLAYMGHMAQELGAADMGYSWWDGDGIDAMRAACGVAVGATERVLKHIASVNVERYIREKAKPERFAAAIIDALLASCSTFADVDAKFDETCQKVASEMSGTPKVETKGVVKDPEPKSTKPESVQKATRYFVGD